MPSLVKKSPKHTVRSNMKWYGMSNNPVKYELLIKQYLRSILDISASLNATVKLKTLYPEPLKSLVLFQFFLGLVKELKRLGLTLCNAIIWRWYYVTGKGLGQRSTKGENSMNSESRVNRAIQENRAHQNKYVSETRRQDRKKILTAIDNKIKEKKQKKLKKCSKSQNLFYDRDVTGQF